MSVISNLGELKSGHHAGLDLKEVWAGGEKAWPSQGEFLTLYGPTNSFIWGWNPHWDPTKFEGNADLAWERFNSSWPVGEADHVFFSDPVTCDMPVEARIPQSRDEFKSYEPGEVIPAERTIRPHEFPRIALQPHTFTIFKPKPEPEPEPDPEPEPGLEDGQVVIFGPEPSYDIRTGSFKGFNSYWDTDFGPEGDTSMVERLSRFSVIFTVPVVAEIDLRVAVSSLTSPRPHPAGERIPAGHLASLPNADGFTSEDQIGNPVIFTRVT